MKNKSLYIIGGLVIIIILYFVLFGNNKVEYVEFTDKRAVRGDLEASVVMVEWSDFECPACGLAYRTVEDVIEKYQDKIKYEYRHFPLPYHQYAYKAAVASECANEQGKFWEYYHKLFLNQVNLSKGFLEQYAKEIGLDTELFDDCLASGVKEKIVTGDFEEGERIGINFTPSIFINGQLVEDWSKLESLVQELIEPVEAAKNQVNSDTVIQ